MGTPPPNPRRNLARVMEVRLGVLAKAEHRPDWLEDVLRSSPTIFSRRTALYIPLTADGEIHPVVLEWSRGLHRTNTAKSYASDVALFFRFLGPGRNWLSAGRADINAFMERRRSGVAEPHDSTRLPSSPVSASTLSRNLVPLRSLYDMASQLGLIDGSPVPTGRFNATKGQSAGDVNWLTRRAYERWRTEGLLGVGSERGESLKMRDRNVAFADLLYRTGLRRAEAAGLLAFEIPNADFSPGLVRGRVPAALSKGSPSRGRIVYLDRSTQRSIESYMVGPREIEVAFGLASGVFEAEPDPLILQQVARSAGIPDKVLLVRPAAGNEARWWSLDSLSFQQRRRIFALDSDGRRRPMMAWLGSGGRPVGLTNWNTVFRSASARTRSRRKSWSTGLDVLDDTTIRVHPHMLRHSFALYVFALAAHMEMRHRGAMTSKGFDAMVRSQNIWLRVQNLLGHKSVETTRHFYLAPVLALEWDWFMRSAEDAPFALDETLSQVASLDDRVIDA